MGPTRDKLVLEPLAVLHLYNQLYMSQKFQLELYLKGSFRNLFFSEDLERDQKKLQLDLIDWLC